jgi:hypothetical protein
MYVGVLSLAMCDTGIVQNEQFSNDAVGPKLNVCLHVTASVLRKLFFCVCEISGFRRRVVEAFAFVSCGVGWQLVTDVSKQPISPIFYGHELQAVPKRRRTVTNLRRVAF